MTVLEWVAAVALVVGSAAVLWALMLFDSVTSDRPRPRAVPRPSADANYRKAA